MPSPSRLVTTTELARAIGLSERTIQRYRREGVLIPDLESPGGHARWDVENVRRQLRELAQQRHRDRWEQGPE